MLSQLRITDFAIIQELVLDFRPGFTVFTGETGAGKSIIIDAVELLLGGRAEASMLREGADLAVVEGVFTIDLPQVRAVLEQDDLLDDPTSLVLAREIRREGRNLCRVNGRVVSLAMLKSLGEWLVDVHGQSEHLSLLRVKEHLPILDRFAGVDTVPYQTAFQQYSTVRREINQLQSAEHDRARREDLLHYQINEIEAAGLEPGETAQLEAERDRLANAERLAGMALNALAALESSSDGGVAALDRLADAAGALLGLSEIDGSMQDVAARAQGLAEEFSELAGELHQYLEQAQPDPIRLDEVEARLGLIHDLKRKYGRDIPAIQAYAARAAEELESVEHSEQRRIELSREQQRLVERMGELGEQMSAQRSQAAQQLSSLIASELDQLQMAGARFEVQLVWEDDPDGVAAGDRKVKFGPQGLDQVEFLIAPNVGEGLKPLVKVASGGETSRLMLGLKSVLARADQRTTLIFDEIDQGIGGRVGAVVGQKLRNLTADHQVLCVTHLPQLAAYAEQHFQVEKQVEAGRTQAIARRLEPEQRVAELAEMLGGDSDANRRSAEALLLTASGEMKQVAALEGAA